MVSIDLQNDQALVALPSLDQFSLWVESSLVRPFSNLEQTIRVVTAAESQSLNARFRGIEKPTNVLSFATDSNYLDYEYLGDLVICAPIVELEAQQQGKSNTAHWAHMVVHGMLHLQGFDHQNDAEANEMEALEAKILSTLGHASPYNG